MVMYVCSFLIDNHNFKVETTNHFEERIKGRGINKEVVVENVFSLKDKIKDYNNSGQEVAVIDEDNDLAFILEVRSSKVVLITAINKSDIFLKNGTEVEEI